MNTIELGLFEPHDRHTEAGPVTIEFGMPFVLCKGANANHVPAVITDLGEKESFLASRILDISWRDDNGLLVPEEYFISPFKGTMGRAHIVTVSLLGLPDRLTPEEVHAGVVKSLPERYGGRVDLSWLLPQYKGQADRGRRVIK